MTLALWGCRQCGKVVFTKKTSPLCYCSPYKNDPGYIMLRIPNTEVEVEEGEKA